MPPYKGWVINVDGRRLSVHLSDPKSRKEAEKWQTGSPRDV